MSEADWTLHPGCHWREVIEEAGMSQAEAAAAAGIDQGALSRIVNGRRLPSAGQTIAFSKSMGVSVKLMWQLRANYELDLALGKDDLTHEWADRPPGA